MKLDTVQVIVVALGLIKKGMDQNLGKVLGAINTGELQKIILFQTARILKFLSSQ